MTFRASGVGASSLAKARALDGRDEPGRQSTLQRPSARGACLDMAIQLCSSFVLFGRYPCAAALFDIVGRTLQCLGAGAKFGVGARVGRGKEFVMRHARDQFRYALECIVPDASRWMRECFSRRCHRARARETLTRACDVVTSRAARLLRKGRGGALRSASALKVLFLQRQRDPLDSAAAGKRT